MGKILSILMLSFFCTIYAQEYYNQEILASSLYCTKVNKMFPEIIGLENGNFLVCWTSGCFRNGREGINGQLFDCYGRKVEGEFLLSPDVEYSRALPTSCFALGGGFITCYVNEETYGEWDIYAKIFDKNCSGIGDEFLVNSVTIGGQNFPDVCSLDDGKFAVCWSSNEQDGSMTGVFGQILNPDGTKFQSEFSINTLTEDEQNYPQIASLSNGRFVVCWEGGGLSDIYCQIFEPNTDKVNSEIKTNAYTNGFQKYPSVCPLDDSGFLICWQGKDKNNTRYYAIYGQMFNLNGEKVGDEIQISSNPNDLENPLCALLKDGQLVITWIVEHSVSDNTITGRILTKNGKKVGREFSINSSGPTSIGSYKLCALTGGGFGVCWDGSSRELDIDGIFTKYYKDTITHQLVSFALKQPSNDSTLGVTNPCFSWHQACQTRINLPHELGYDLYVSKDEGFTDPIIVKDIYDTTFQVKNLQKGTTYFWKVCAQNIAGDSLWSSETNAFFINHNAIHNVEKNLEIPEHLNLFANYPNPFNSGTTIRYELPAQGTVTVKIFDITGRLVTQLVNTVQESGMHNITWHECDKNRLPAAAGV